MTNKTSTFTDREHADMDTQFMSKLASFLKQVNEDASYKHKPDWLIGFGGSVEDYEQDLARWLRIGLFAGLTRDPYLAEEVKAMVESGAIPTEWIDPVQQNVAQK